MYTVLFSWKVKDGNGRLCRGAFIYIVFSDGQQTPALADRILDQNDYLPFGTRIDGSTYARSATNRWRYAGKEEQVFVGSGASGLNFGLLDFGARYYDPFIGRWTTIDPMAAYYTSWSGYNYCLNDPLYRYDSNGEVPRIYIQHNDLGHAFITTGEGDNTTVYTYGRYGRTYKSSGIIPLGHFSPKGEGVLGLLKGDSAKDYLKMVQNNGNFEVFELTEGSEGEIDNYYSDLFEAGTTPTNPKKSSYNDSNYRVIDELVHDNVFRILSCTKK